MRKLFVDDERLVPIGWEVARTYQEAIELLSIHRYDELSLDHDLGCFDENGVELNGRKILLWLIERKIITQEYVPPVILVHSANPEGARIMKEDIKRYWG